MHSVEEEASWCDWFSRVDRGPGTSGYEISQMRFLKTTTTTNKQTLKVADMSGALKDIQSQVNQAKKIDLMDPTWLQDSWGIVYSN